MSNPPIDARLLMAWAPNSENPEEIEMDPLFIGLIFRLPKMGAQWSTEQRVAWVKMFHAIADGLHPESLMSEERANTRTRIALPGREIEASGTGDFVKMQIHNFLKPPEFDNVAAGPAEEPRRFIQQTPYAGSKEAAPTIIEMIRQAGKPAHVWYDKTDGRIRVCAEDYQGEEHEIFVGVYDVKVKPSRIISDLKEVRASVLHEGRE